VDASHHGFKKLSELIFHIYNIYIEIFNLDNFYVKLDYTHIWKFHSWDFNLHISCTKLVRIDFL